MVLDQIFSALIAFLGVLFIFSVLNILVFIILFVIGKRLEAKRGHDL
jgi:Na+-transporting methylmalonyl-CoA/oxaloacetate decarboxylase gamma subunit